MRLILMRMERRISGGAKEDKGGATFASRQRDLVSADRHRKELADSRVMVGFSRGTVAKQTEILKSTQIA